MKSNQNKFMKTFFEYKHLLTSANINQFLLIQLTKGLLEKGNMNLKIFNK